MYELERAHTVEQVYNCKQIRIVHTSWRSGFFGIKDRVPAWINFVAKLSCMFAGLTFFYFNSFYNQSPPI